MVEVSRRAVRPRLKEIYPCPLTSSPVTTLVSTDFGAIFERNVNANLGPTALDLDVPTMNAQGTAWDTEYPAHLSAQKAVSAVKATKDNRRGPTKRRSVA
ncbi:MAG: hypothetical protein ACR2HJ_08195 [Fimbriimonadales bacterium]